MKTPSYFPFSKPKAVCGRRSPLVQLSKGGFRNRGGGRRASSGGADVSVGETCFMRFTKKAPSKSQGRGPGSPGN